MIQSFIQTITPLTTNTDSVVFQRDCIRTNSCNRWICHNQGSSNYDIVDGGLYEIDFNASIASATAGVLSFGLFNNGELIAGSEMIANVGADEYSNIGINKKIRVCCKGNANISVRSIASVPTPSTPTTPITTQIPIIASANFSITRLS